MPNPGKTIFVIQHTDGEFLGLIEDHLEGRGIGFTYIRPHANSGRLPATLDFAGGVVFLGGGPWGTAGARNLPTLNDEVLLARECLERGVPVIGFGLGSQILALAGGGQAESAALRFAVGDVVRSRDDALNGYLPVRFPIAVYMRDRVLLPDSATVLAVEDSGAPAVFQIGASTFGFTGHPGIKSAMVEDLIMEFDEAPDDCGETLETLRSRQREIEDAAVPIMTGLIQMTGLMEPQR
jgi:GMP synthase-like glutamine amidotransferase